MINSLKTQRSTTIQLLCDSFNPWLEDPLGWGMDGGDSGCGWYGGLACDGTGSMRGVGMDQGAQRDPRTGQCMRSSSHAVPLGTWSLPATEQSRKHRTSVNSSWSSDIFHTKLPLVTHISLLAGQYIQTRWHHFKHFLCLSQYIGCQMSQQY